MKLPMYIAILLTPTIVSASCHAKNDLCDQARIKLHDQDLYTKVFDLLTSEKVIFSKGEEREICYRASDHELIRSYIISVDSKTNPIRSRIDLARGMDDEVIELLRGANVRFTWSIEGDRLVLIVDPEDYERANQVIDELFEKKFSGK